MHDALALVFPRTQLTRAALLGYADDAERILRIAGIQAHDRVALQLHNTPEGVIAFLALARIGCSIVIADERSLPSGTDMAFMACCAWTVTDTAADATESVLVGDRAPRRVRMDGVVRLPPGLVAAPPGDRVQDVFSGSWLTRADGIVMVTSGSTGAPALVEKRPSNVIANAHRTARRIGYRPDDVLLPILPVCHQYGFSVLMIGLLLGLPVVLGTPTRTLEVLRLGRRFGATVVDTIPRLHDVILRAIEAGRISPDTLSGVRLWCVGGAPVSRQLQTRAQAVHGHALLDGYGSTELGNIAHVDPEDSMRLLPLGGISLRVVDEEGAELTTGRWGSLLVATPDAPDRPWHATGDLARLHDDGSLTVAGRSSAVLRRGEVIYPAAVEHLLAQSGLHAVCVPTSSPDEAGDHRLSVIVETAVRRETTALRGILESHLPPAWMPDVILTRDVFPRTAVSGKVDRGRLREFALAHEAAESEIGVPFPERLTALARVRAHLLRYRERITAILRDCSSREAAEIEVDATLRALGGALGEVVMNRPPAVPHSWVYMPSNVVLYSYALYLLIPSLYTDQIRFRPSSRVREATLRLHAELAEVHDLPIEAFDGSQRLFADERTGLRGMVVFTGKYANAEQVREGLEEGQVMTFFGQGTNPLIIGDAADATRASEDAVRMRLLNSGQDCFGPDLHLVHRAVVDEFVGGIVSGLRGHSLEELLARREDHLAVRDPLVLRDVVDHVGAFRDDIRWGGRIDLRNMLVEPVVLQWDIRQAPLCSEVFAPVFNVAVYDHEDEVKMLLSSTFYEERSMCASVYGVSEALLTWCSTRMTVSVDATIVATDDPGQAFGGVGVMANFVATRRSVHAGAILLSETAATYASEFESNRIVDVTAPQYTAPLTEQARS